MKISRRKALMGVGASLGAPTLLKSPAWAERRFAGLLGTPFSLGVASGDPTPDGVVLWTRLVPDFTDPRALGTRSFVVDFELAEDENFTSLVRRGSQVARPELGHSVHVEARGLQAGRTYFYRFHVGGITSPVGRTRTLPAWSALPDTARVGVASCQHYEHGYFSAYRDMVAQDPNFILHLGDYIYESSWGPQFRQHEGVEPLTLDDYRMRHALYKLDPDLQAAHAHCPWFFMWDDHEVDNDYAGSLPEDRSDPEAFRARRNAAYQAFYENMPIARERALFGNEMRLYQRVQFGRLMEMNIADTRQYRDDHPCQVEGQRKGRVAINCEERLDPARTVLGSDQERWLLGGFGRSNARWSVLAQPMLMARLQQTHGSEVSAWTDAWDGFVGSRTRFTDMLGERRPNNPIILGGDMHQYWVTDLKQNYDEENSETLASEFVGTSITSFNNRHQQFQNFLPMNPHIKYMDARHRGYMICDVTPEKWTTTFRIQSDVRDAGATTSTHATFVVEDGKAGAVEI